MSNPEISLIVPVYNVEKYLKQCIDSILVQTFSDFELICVNDGSTDNSGKILEEYKNRDIRIKIIDKKNGGLSSARNTGMKYAKGNFLCFIDSDDWIATDMLEKLHDNIMKFNSDIAMCAVNLFDEKNQCIQQDSYFNFSVFSKNYDNKIFSYEDTKSFIMDIPVMAWNKIYRSSFLKTCDALFPENKIFEDGAFFFSIYFKTKRVSMLRNRLYYYRINRKNSILQKNGKNFLDIIDIVNLMFDELKQSSIFEDVKYAFYKRKADDIIYRYQMIKKSLKKKFAQKFKKDSCLLNETFFDFSKINNEEPITYKCLCKIKNSTSIFALFKYKFKRRLMRKIIQIIEADRIFYFIKLWNLKIYLKKYKNFCDIYYKKDKIYVCIFNKINFNFKFEYSKLEKKL